LFGDRLPCSQFGPNSEHGSLSPILQRELHKCGISISIPRAIDELNGICEVTLLKKEGEGRLSAPQIVLSKMNALQRQMFEALNLKHYREN
jgi:hypothetical protein